MKLPQKQWWVVAVYVIYPACLPHSGLLCQTMHSNFGISGRCYPLHPYCLHSKGEWPLLDCVLKPQGWKTQSRRPGNPEGQLWCCSQRLGCHSPSPAHLQTPTCCSGTALYVAHLRQAPGKDTAHQFTSVFNLGRLTVSKAFDFKH